MSNELQKTNPGTLFPVVDSPYDNSLFTEVDASSSFWPRLQLFTSSSDSVKEGTIEAGYGIVENKDQIIQLGRQVDVLVLAWRPRAVNVKADPVISTSDVKSPVFAEIKKMADEPDSGCMFGYEFAVYVPQTGTYCTFFMGSKSARREAKKVYPLIGKAATLRMVLLSNARYKWHAVQALPCSTPFDVPPIDQIQAKIQEFLNPPASEDVVEETNDSRDR